MMSNQPESHIFLRGLLRDSSSLFAVKIFMPLSYFIITVSIARFLGVRDFGILGILFSFYAIFRIIAVFGIDSFLLKEIPIKPEKAGDLFSNALSLGLMLSFLSIIIMNFLFFVMRYPPQVRLIGLVVSVLLLAEPINRYSESVFISFGKSKYILISTFIAETLKIFLSLAVMVVLKNLIAVLAVILLAQLLTSLLKIIFLRKLSIYPKLLFDRDIIRDLFGSSFTLALISAASAVFLSIDVIVLSKIAGEEAVGFYSAAYKFITLLFLVADSIGLALLPFLSRVFRESSVLFADSAAKVVKYFVILGVFSAVSFFFASEQAIRIIYGVKYYNSVQILRILSWCSVFFCGSYIYARMLLAIGRQKYDLFALLIAITVNFLLNIYLTLRLGVIGTACATTVSALILLILHSYFFHRSINCSNPLTTWIKLIFTASFYFIFFGYLSRINIYFAFAVSSIVYFTALSFLKVIKKEELLILARAVYIKK